MLLRKRLFRVLGAMVGLVVTAVIGGSCALSAKRWNGPASDHFDGKSFFTPGGRRVNRNLGDFVRWMRTREPGAWGAYRFVKPGSKPPARAPQNTIRVTWINHATALIQQDGVNVLTDPIYSERCSPFGFVGPRRVRPPGVPLGDLPRIDAVVLSHNHYDHMDLPTLRALQDLFPDVRIFAGLGNGATLVGAGLRHVTEVDWWQTFPVGAVKIHSVPTQHFSNRALFDADATLWTGYVMESAAGKTYFAGDTGYGSHFLHTRERIGPIDIALLPIGAFRPEWFMGPIHMSPDDAVTAARDLQARQSIPIHYGTFPLADDGETEPLDQLRAAAAGSSAPPFSFLGFGEALELAQ